ncbi:MAG TPA: HD domain-containing protein [Steroidobacteraceae bacterium]|nr:HD domain-containing protein [Steroidobacteraceae bacterium]
MSVAEEILRIYATGGAGAYFGEQVSMREHALQSAHFARLDGASDALVLASLLHDIGHLLEELPEEIGEWTEDARHEQSGARWLAPRFDVSISEPVRLHVAAKRYLCATDATYLSRLSAASVHTLRLQGGPMSTGEAAQFEREPFAGEALHVRRWDDQGKVAGLETAALASYVPLIDRAARAP